MSDKSQISARVSAATKEELDRFTDRYRLNKNYVIEQALLYFMEAHREMADDPLVPVRLVLDDNAFDRIVQQLESCPTPTDALRELMRRRDH